MSMLHRINSSFFLIFFLLLGGFLRFYNLDTIPPGIHGDEASIGYNAYSLLKTLRDQEGNFLPLAIDQFGDFRPAGYHYITIPFIALFDLNEIGIRFPSALFGTASILVFYFLITELFRNKSIGLLGGFLLTISPWHIVISRATSEGIVAGFFIILGMYLYLHFIRSKTNYFTLLLSIISFIVSYLFYHSARLFVPLFIVSVIPLIFATFERKKWKTLIVPTFIFFFSLTISLLIILSMSQGTARPTSISIFNIPGGTALLKHQMDQDGVQNPLITRFFHNKLYFYSRLFANSYFQHFSGDFLYVDNGLPMRYRMPWTGNFYIIEGFFFLIGFAVLVAEGLKNKKYYYLIPVFWLFLGPVPSGLTWEDIPNVQRASLMIYAMHMIAAFGVFEFFKLFHNKKRLFVIFFISCLLFQNFAYFAHNYYYHSRINEPWHRSAAERELIFTISLLEKRYKKIIMTTQNNNNFIFYLLYNKYDPKKFQEQGSPREKDNLQFGKIRYTYSSCPIEGNPRKNATGNYNVLFVNKNGCTLPLNAHILNTIRTPDGIPAFEVIELKEGIEESPEDL